MKKENKIYRADKRYFKKFRRKLIRFLKEGGKDFIIVDNVYIDGNGGKKKEGSSMIIGDQKFCSTTSLFQLKNWLAKEGVRLTSENVSPVEYNRQKICYKYRY